MATNNYYGFTHGGTQYANQYASNPAPPGYTSAASYAAPQPQTQSQNAAFTAGASEQYVLGGYTRPAGQPVTANSYYPAQNAGAYTTTAAVAPAKVGNPPSGVAASTMYPSYSANTAGTNTSNSYPGFPQAAPPSANQTPAQPKTSFTNYDAAVYNAVTAYAQSGPNANRGGVGFKRGANQKMKSSRGLPKPQTLHYCDVCKISCAGPQTYKEHLEGQKHKKKEAAQKAGTVVSKGSTTGLRCELCDVTCTGSDAYAAHIRGSKHQKVLKLHTKLGKPIPSDSPTVVSSVGPVFGPHKAPSNGPQPPKQQTAVPVAQKLVQNANSPTVPKSAPPKINFVGSNTKTPSTIFPADAPQAVSSSQYPSPSTMPAKQDVAKTETVSGSASNDASSADAQFNNEKDIQPVGQDYIEEIKSDDGKIISFNCKLCECRFNDPNAKEMHMKGRRHRLQFKKKVNPSLVVDVKPSNRRVKTEERRTKPGNTRRQMPVVDVFRGNPMPLMPPAPRNFVPSPMYGAPNHPFFAAAPRRHEGLDDKYVMAKHTEIYPKEEELDAIQTIVYTTEKALKLVSDKFAEVDSKKGCDSHEDKHESDTTTDKDIQNFRTLKGVMRVGHLAKGLLLKGDRKVELVVLCSEKPSIEMLQRIFECLPEQLKKVAKEETYDVGIDIENASLLISSTVEPKIDVSVTLTSPLLRNLETSAAAAGEAQATQVKEEPDLLDKKKCLDALAALRHAKWFQARATTLHSCVIVIRILRDLCQRVASWHSMPCWAIELLTEKAMSTAGIPLSPGDGLKLVFEVVSSGILLPDGPGLLDPCEKDSLDCLETLTPQMRDEITAFAQNALRKMMFGQTHLVLGIEKVSSIKKGVVLNNRKRRRDQSGSMEVDETVNGTDGKKDKKEATVETDNALQIKTEK